MDLKRKIDVARMCDAGSECVKVDVCFHCFFHTRCVFQALGIFFASRLAKFIRRYVFVGDIRHDGKSPAPERGTVSGKVRRSHN